jgi:N-acetylglucosamine kinase-like BadF-type ATPase
MELGMNAAELFGDGILSLSGTGATMFARYNGRHFGTGGYGAAVSDAGSGYWIGRAAFNAAIEDDEGRGVRTILTDLLAEKLGGTRANFGHAIFAIYGKTDISPTAYVASCTPLVYQAAMAGDTAAMRILERAGYLIGAQTVAMVRKNKLPTTLPITISGSVWRSHPLLFDSYRDTLSKAGMEGNLPIPAFEPIVGAVIGHAHRAGVIFDDAFRAQLTEDYKKHAFEVSSDLRLRPNPQKLVPTVKADAPAMTGAERFVIDL